MILVVAEQRDGKLNRASWEAIAAGQRLAAKAGGAPVKVAVLGGDVAAAAAELAAADVAEVLAVESPALETYTADGFVAALDQLLTDQAPAYVLFPHTYLARDFVPKLAARVDRPLIADVVALADAGGQPAFTRLIFQGKLAADVVPDGDAPCLVTVQAGAFGADTAARGAAPAPVTKVTAVVDAGAIRQKPDAPFREAKQAVDLSQAARIVAVGRGHPRAGQAAARRGTGEGARGRNWRPRGRFATPAGCRSNARSGARARPWRRSSTSRSGSLARSSTPSA